MSVYIKGTKQHYHSLLKDAPFPVIAIDLKMNVILWNTFAETVFGWKEREIIGHPFPIVPDFEKEKFFHILQRAMNGETILNIEAKRKRRNGTLIDVSINLFPWHDDNENVTGFIATFYDITEQKLELMKTYKELEDFKFALDASATVSITDSEGTILYVNDRFCDTTNFTRDELIGNNHRLVNSGYHPKEYFQTMWDTISKGKVWSGEVRNRSKDGRIWWANATIIPFLDKENKPYQYIAVRSDITDRKRMEEELQNQKQRVEQFAYFDYLTGLPNRRLFEVELKRKLDEAIKNQTKLALLFLDLDGFKFINDTLGHEIGDKLLRDVSQRLNQNRRVTDFVSRLGGDEFTIIVSDVEEIEEIYHIAQQTLELFEWPFLIASYELFISTSIGVSLYPHGGNSFNDLIRNADLAMYRAKDLGKNNYVIYSPTLNVGSYKKFSLKNDLRKAIQEKEIFTLYQPKVDSKTNKIVGVEALARWEHPEWGVVSPEEFIPLAEETGLINTLGEQILLQACVQNKKWQDEGHHPIKMSVNFSALQFLQADIVGSVENILLQSGLEAKWLEIELTETVVMQNEAGTLLKLDRLRELGISIAIDDFGIGYSSLGYLKKIKPNTVKIDKSFVQEIPSNPENTEIATAIIKLAGNLNMNVVAEGVETMEQVSYLRKIHCDELQGYIFSKPILPEEFEALLKKGISLSNREVHQEYVSFENRRKYFRIDLPRPLVGEMTITSLGGKQVKLGMTKVLIEDIGPGGVRFTSNIKLPARPDLVLKIGTWILEQKIEATGTIVWSKEVDEGQQYGVQLNVNDKKRDTLMSILNQFQVKLRKEVTTSTSSFLTTSREEFFK